MENYKETKDEIGIDEAGRGPFFGPVYAAAVVWGKAPDNELIKDSKKLSKKKRKEAVEWIKENIKLYGIGFCTSDEIDKLNIIDATKLAMERAINQLLEKDNKYSGNLLVIDGIGWENKKFNININKYEINQVIKGDAKYRNIAAASILAKEAHDEHIIKLCLENDDLNLKYDLVNNKGYGTKKHIEGIKNHGLSKFHRHSFNINY
jgi:ribonuclease HII